MRVVVDQDLHLEKTAIPPEWELLKREGRAINNGDVQDADALLVRSVTKVDEALLANSRIRFVGTATSGLNHIDRAYLQANNIRLADAAGSNANAVADYCLAALAYCVLHRGLDLGKARIGIIGAGHVGGLLANKLNRLGLQPLICDPPLQQTLKGIAVSDAPKRFSSLEEVATCDVLSLHVPLNETGQHATREMIDEKILSSMPVEGVVINSSRGEVIDEQALRAHLQSNPRFTAVLDVWHNEPMLNADTLRLAHIATPHIAGYSARAKDEAARRIVDALAEFAGVEAVDTAPSASGKTGQTVDPMQDTAAIDPGNKQAWKRVQENLDLPELSSQFRQVYAGGHEKQAFDAMRKSLSSRLEFCETQLGAVAATEAGFLRALGFRV